MRSTQPQTKTISSAAVMPSLSEYLAKLPLLIHASKEVAALLSPPQLAFIEELRAGKQYSFRLEDLNDLDDLEEMLEFICGTLKQLAAVVQSNGIGYTPFSPDAAVLTEEQHILQRTYGAGRQALAGVLKFIFTTGDDLKQDRINTLLNLIFTQPQMIVDHPEIAAEILEYFSTKENKAHLACVLTSPAYLGLLHSLRPLIYVSNLQTFCQARSSPVEVGNFSGLRIQQVEPSDAAAKMEQADESIQSSNIDPISELEKKKRIFLHHNVILLLTGLYFYNPVLGVDNDRRLTTEADILLIALTRISSSPFEGVINSLHNVEHQLIWHLVQVKNLLEMFLCNPGHYNHFVKKAVYRNALKVAEDSYRSQFIPATPLSAIFTQQPAPLIQIKQGHGRYSAEERKNVITLLRNPKIFYATTTDRTNRFCTRP